MTADTQLAGVLEDDPAKNRNGVETRLAGPAQGSAGVLQSCMKPFAMARSYTNQGIVVTPPEVRIQILRFHQVPV